MLASSLPLLPRSEANSEAGTSFAGQAIRIRDKFPSAGNWGHRYYAGDHFELERSGSGIETSRLRIRASGGEIAFKRRSPGALRSTLPAYDWLRGLPPWTLLLVLLASILAALLVLIKTGQTTPWAAEHPVKAATVGFVALTLALPAEYASAGGGGGGSTTERRWMLSDGLGTSNGIVTQDSYVEREAVLSPFGGVISEASSGPGNAHSLSYAGHRRELNTGLTYMKARWQDPETGSFLSVDPLVPSASDPQFYNGYAYVRNNPINFNDPDGRCPRPIFCGVREYSAAGVVYTRSLVGTKEDGSKVTWAKWSITVDSSGTIVSVNDRGGKPTSAGSIASAVAASASLLASGSASGLFAASASPVPTPTSAPGPPLRLIPGGAAGGTARAAAGGALSPIAAFLAALAIVLTPSDLGDPGEPNYFYRVTTPGLGDFQLRQGEDGASVFLNNAVSPPLAGPEILANFRPESGLTIRTPEQIAAAGLMVERTPAPKLPLRLDLSHHTILPGAGMSRKQFKAALKNL